jgi:hypothetical protein
MLRWRILPGGGQILPISAALARRDRDDDTSARPPGSATCGGRRDDAQMHEGVDEFGRRAVCLAGCWFIAATIGCLVLRSADFSESMASR